MDDDMLEPDHIAVERVEVPPGMRPDTADM